MELLDFREELRDIWLWLGEDDWLLARSHVAPAVDEPEAAPAPAPIAEQEAPAPPPPPAPPPTTIVPGWVTITIGWTEAPILPASNWIQNIKYKIQIIN
jgi:hypothetical protein